MPYYKKSRRTNAYKELKKVLGWTKKEQYTALDDIPEPKPVKIPVNPVFSFDDGHQYIIDGGDYIFGYEGKQGKHHMFREIKGNWTRTYTDAQLVGKKVLEVKI